MQVVLVLLHIVVCLALIAIVLLQTGKGAEIGAVFGGSSQTLFGSSGGSTFFNKLTTAVAIVFMLTSLILANLSSQYSGESVMTGVKPAATAPAPETSSPQSSTEPQEQAEPQAPAAEKATADAPEQEAK
jgi:preprotein translocase subunit SecG